jgi:putative transposase
MGRPLRLKAPQVTYHITSRTNGRRLFLRKKQDQKALCKILKRTLLKHAVIIYAFSPMNNHFHMLIRIEKNADLSQFMCEFKSYYSKYFNKKYKTCGHFWGDRFKSTIVQDDRHALACLRYIDRNPVKAGLVDHPAKWSYNSFHSYAYGKNHPLLPLQPHPTYLALAKSRAKRHVIYLKFVTNEDQESDELFGKLSRLQVYGTGEFNESIKRQLSFVPGTFRSLMPPKVIRPLPGVAGTKPGKSNSLPRPGSRPARPAGCCPRETLLNILAPGPLSSLPKARSKPIGRNKQNVRPPRTHTRPPG